MSWQGYITSLTQQGHLQKAAIISVDGEHLLGASPDFKLSMSTRKTIVDLLASEEARNRGFEKGLALEFEGSNTAEDYAVVRADESSSQLRCKVKDKEKAGVCIGKSAMCIIIGYYDVNSVAGNANLTVQSYVDYLNKSG